MDLIAQLPEEVKSSVQTATEKDEGGGAAKRRGIVPKADEQMRDELTINSKLNLWCAQQVRQLKGFMVSCFLLEDKSPYIQGVKTEVAAFQKAQKQLLDSGKEQEEVDKMLGPIHIWGLNGLIKAGLEDGKIDNGKKEKIKEAMKEWAKDKEEMELHATHCRVSRRYNSDVKRLEISIPFLMMADQLDREKGHLTVTGACKILLSAVAQQPRFRRLPGVSPAGKLEKDLQKMVGDK